jgi:plastocyanin
MRILATLAALLFVAGAAQAADLTVQVRDAAGRPVADAVVFIQEPGRPASAPVKFSWPMAMSQHQIAFEPHMLVVPVGSDVTFPNRDTVRHHVYSFSPAKTFELKLYGREEARTVHFDKAGPVALGCNIHDRMSGFIYVVDTPYAAKTDAAGAATLQGLRAGAATLTIWHPYMKAPHNTLNLAISVAGDRTQAVTADIRPPPGH